MFDLINGDIFSKLTLFHHVIRYGSITGAAEAIHKNSSSVSRQIKQLEEELGITLLVRRPDGVFPTEAGNMLYNSSQELIAKAEELLKDVENVLPPQKLTGTVRFLAAPVSQNLLEAILPKILTRYPEVRLDILLSQGAEAAIMSLMTFEYAFWLAPYAKYPPTVEFSPLFTSAVCLIAPKNFQIPAECSDNIRLLADLSFIDIDKKRSVSRFICNECKRLNFPFFPRHTAFNLQFQISMVRTGFGVAFVDETSLRNMDTSGIQIIPMHQFAKRQFGIVSRKNAFHPHRVRAILDLLQETCADTK